MDISQKVTLNSSTVLPPVDGSVVLPADPNLVLTAVILLRRQTYKGLTMMQYADQILAGNNHPILSYDEFSQNFSTSDTDMTEAKTFATLSELAIIESNPAAAMIKVSGSVAQFNNAFSVSLQSITTPAGKTYIGYQGVLSIPAELDNVIEFIIGLNNPVVMRHLATRADLESKPIAASAAGVTYSLLTPLQVAAAYNFPPSNGYGQCIGLIEYGGGYTQQNLTSSFSPLGIANPTMVDVSVDGGTNNPGDPSGSSVEVMLDIFVAGAIAPASKFAVYFGAGSGNPIPGPNWYDPVNTAIHDTVNKPSVLSISWGESEASFGQSNMTAMDSVLAQAAVLGITICVASGDSGSTWTGTGLEVLYPGSSPYVLSCGGTSLALSGSSIVSEVVWNESAVSAGAGGGGISIYESKPSYQTGLTYKTYPAGVVSNLNVRGVPDVAGNADPYSGYSYYYDVSNTFAQGVGGTSAVAPLWAALIARLNALTGTRRGLFNTWLYSNPSSCSDITSGNNFYTPYAPYGISSGYSATTGWDACTGLGSPNGSNMFRLLNTGSVYPSYSFGFRPSTGAVYPRLNTGLRAT